jgi:FkbM family methyltransferase
MQPNALREIEPRGDRLSLLGRLTNFYPFMSGCGRLANCRLMRWFAPYSSDYRWVHSPGGYVRASMNDFIGRAVFFFGDLDPKVTWILRRLLEPGDHAVDVGANIGVVTLLMSKLVSPGGTVQAFEPNPVLFEDLRAALAINSVTNVQLHQAALGSSDSDRELYVPAGNSGEGSFIERGVTQQVHRVRVTRLDDISLDGEIALLKLDVEGAEYEVLRGAQRILAEQRPRVILFEANYHGDRIVDMLRQHDYKILAIPQCLAYMRTFTFDPPMSPTHDLIAAPSGIPFERLRAKLRAC